MKLSLTEFLRLWIEKNGFCRPEVVERTGLSPTEVMHIWAGREERVSLWRIAAALQNAGYTVGVTFLAPSGARKVTKA